MNGTPNHHPAPTAPPDAVGAAEQHNPYAAPAAPLEDSAAGRDQVFYVVGAAKFWIMSIGTFGLYSLYWFWRQWDGLKRRGHACWPVWRAIFSIFWTHALFAQVDARLRDQGEDYRWPAAAMATLYVVCTVASHILDRLAALREELSWMDLSGLVLFPAVVFALYRGQRAINVAEGDPVGERNGSLTWANALWLVPCVLLWLLIIVGATMIAGEMPLE